MNLQPIYPEIDLRLLMDKRVYRGSALAGNQISFVVRGIRLLGEAIYLFPEIGYNDVGYTFSYKGQAAGEWFWDTDETPAA